MIPIGRGAGVVEGPVTEAGWRLAKVHAERKVWPSQRNDPNAGPDGFIHYCANLCDPRKYPCDTLLAVLASETEAAQAARAEVIAEIRAGVEGLGPISQRYGAGKYVERAAVLALLPPTEPKT